MLNVNQSRCMHHEQVLCNMTVSRWSMISDQEGQNEFIWHATIIIQLKFHFEITSYAKRVTFISRVIFHLGIHEEGSWQTYLMSISRAPCTNLMGSNDVKLTKSIFLFHCRNIDRSATHHRIAAFDYFSLRLWWGTLAPVTTVLWLNTISDQCWDSDWHCF